MSTGLKNAVLILGVGVFDFVLGYLVFKYVVVPAEMSLSIVMAFIIIAAFSITVGMQISNIIDRNSNGKATQVANVAQEAKT